MSYYEKRKKILKERVRLGHANNNLVKLREAKARLDELEEANKHLGGQPEEAIAADEPEEKSPLWNARVADLKEMAKDAGLDGYSSMRKAELIEALSE